MDYSDTEEANRPVKKISVIKTDLNIIDSESGQSGSTGKHTDDEINEDEVNDESDPTGSDSHGPESLEADSPGTVPKISEEGLKGEKPLSLDEKIDRMQNPEAYKDGEYEPPAKLAKNKVYQREVKKKRHSSKTSIASKASGSQKESPKGEHLFIYLDHKI